LPDESPHQDLGTAPDRSIAVAFHLPKMAVSHPQRNDIGGKTMIERSNCKVPTELVTGSGESSDIHPVAQPSSWRTLVGAFRQSKGRPRRTGTLIALGLALSLGASVLISGQAAAAPEPSATTVMFKHLANIPGKEALMLMVTYPPGGADPVHRHDAHAFIYVLEGSIVMAVKGGKEVTLNPGQSFYEGPDDIHTVGRNASDSRPARFIVLMIKEKGVPPFLPIR
jgi:quercetin dioxygenase-like cupin family protein